MTLRPTPHPTSPPSGPLARRSLAAFGAASALLILALGAGRAQAAVSDYRDPLHLSAATSSAVTGSFGFSGSALAPATCPSATPAWPCAPTATAITGGTLPTATGYAYAYTVVDPVRGESAPSATASATTTSFPSRRQIQLGNLPTGITLRIYRKRSGRFHRLVELTNNSSTTYVDSNATEPPSATILPQSENRVDTGVIGYAPFEPGVPVSASSTDNTPVTASAPTTPTGKGWLVDGPGAVFFPAGTWTLETKTFSVHGNGEAHLVVGMWKVKTSGGAITASTLLLDPNSTAAESGTNLVTASSTVQTITHSVSLPAFELGLDEHLYVQLWRRQTVAYTTAGGTESRVATLYANDGTARLAHPAATTAPVTPSLSLPGADAFVRAGPTLRAVYDDPDGDSGRVRFRLCTLPSPAGVRCTNGVVAGLSELLADGGLGVWRSPVTLRDRVYYWQARSEDAFGAVSSWSATRRLVLTKRLIRILSPTRLVCTVGGRLAAEVRLARAAHVAAKLYTRSRFDLARPFGRRAQGQRVLSFALPYTLERPAVYWIRWVATRGSERAVASMRVEVRSLRPGASPSCRRGVS